MKKKVTLFVSLAAASVLYAADNYNLDEISVSTAKEGFVDESKTVETPAAQTFTKKAIETFGKQMNTNVFKVIDMSPSVNFSPVDAFGSNESSFHDPIRIRGKNQSGPGGILSVEDLPVNGNPGGGKTIYDMEDFSAIELYKGYMPVDKGLGYSNLIGKVDLTFDRPKSKFGGELAQTLGSENTSRTFIRIDSGKVGDVSAFGSFSYTNADKFKGDGSLKRTNGTIGLVYTPTDSFKTEVFAVNNRDEHNNYYQLTYAETKDMDKNFDKDYGNDSKLAAYADYNKQNFEDTMVMANIEYKLPDGSKFTLKPYYLHDDGEYWFASSSSATMAVNWLIDHELYGAVAKYEKTLTDALNMKIGYWAGKQQPPGPPSAQKKYNVSSGKPVFAGWVVLSKNEYSDFNTPFVEFSGKAGKWGYSAGVRYLNFKLGALKSYTNGTSATSSQNYDTAIANGTEDSWASVSAKTYTEWLPSFYLSYAAAKDTNIYIDYSRSYGYDVNLFPTYVQSRSTFVGKGVTLQSLWDKQKLEISDNYELGVKYKHGQITYNPNIFMTKVKNKQATVYDPNFGVAYPTNASDATSYGAELAISGAATDNIDFMVSGAYNKYYYDNDIQTSGSYTAKTAGNQIPDAPEWMAKGAVTYKLGNWNFTPTIKYIDKRYGDVENQQTISAYTLVDFDTSYTAKKLFGSKEAIFRLTMTNLTNQKYVSSIITADNALAASTTSTSYQTGAPFGAYLSANFKF